MSRFINKFGRNDDLGTGAQEQIWMPGGNKVLGTASRALYVSSSNAGDTQKIEIELQREG